MAAFFFLVETNLEIYISKRANAKGIRKTRRKPTACATGAPQGGPNSDFKIFKRDSSISAIAFDSRRRGTDASYVCCSGRKYKRRTDEGEKRGTKAGNHARLARHNEDESRDRGNVKGKANFRINGEGPAPVAARFNAMNSSSEPSRAASARKACATSAPQGRAEANPGRSRIAPAYLRWKRLRAEWNRNRQLSHIPPPGSIPVQAFAAIAD